MIVTTDQQAAVLAERARPARDRYLARPLRDLDDQQLADLDARQQIILDNPPPFDATNSSPPGRAWRACRRQPRLER